MAPQAVDMHLLYEDAAPEKKVEDVPEKKAEDAADVEMKGMDVVAGIDHWMAMFAFEQQGVGVLLCHRVTSC